MNEIDKTVIVAEKILKHDCPSLRMLEDVWTNLLTELDSNRETIMSWRVLVKNRIDMHVWCVVKEDRWNLLRWNYLSIVYLHTKIAKIFYISYRD